MNHDWADHPVFCSIIPRPFDGLECDSVGGDFSGIRERQCIFFLELPIRAAPSPVHEAEFINSRAFLACCTHQSWAYSSCRDRGIRIRSRFERRSIYIARDVPTNNTHGDYRPEVAFNTILSVAPVSE